MNIYDLKRQIGRPTDWLTSTYWPVVLLTWLFILLITINVYRVLPC